MRKIAGYLTKNRSGKDQKIAQSTHENGYIKPRKTFWRNSKQLLSKYLVLMKVPGRILPVRVSVHSCFRIRVFVFRKRHG
ncbi:hypothetical protein B5F71_06590 [Bacteroides sp. An269]|nr:hypothetical protein B5G04_11575 [Bacteroides sp. An51A]OUO80882.1 hypothetical protein B5F71_06590 [Bacteroides sp. An269]